MSDKAPGEKKQEEGKTKVKPNGQLEMTIADTPLYKACERVLASRVALTKAKKEELDAEKDLLAEMKNLKKNKIGHGGVVIKFVKGKITNDRLQISKT